MNATPKTKNDEKGITIYRGGSHRIECRDGLHVQVNDDGSISPAGKCHNWAGGCPAKRMRDAGPDLAEALSKALIVLRGIDLAELPLCGQIEAALRKAGAI